MSVLIVRKNLTFCTVQYFYTVPLYLLSTEYRTARYEDGVAKILL